MSFQRKNFRRQSAAAVRDKQLQNAVRKTAGLLAQMRANTVADKPAFEQLRSWGRSRKLAVSADLEYWLALFSERLNALGATVHRAKDSAEANRIVTAIAHEQGISTAVKSKSMTTEEIELNKALEKAGVDVVETDLGEFIIQLAGEHPSHILAPAIHRSQQQVRQLFAEKLGAPDDLDIEGLVRFARQVLRQRFLDAGMGITGCNFAVADSGTMAIVTNEGNGRMCTTLPRIQVALVGIEKLIPSLDDLADFLSLLTCSATGQRASSYINMTTGPRRAGETEGPEQLHVVLLDNHRRDIAESPWREMLHCLHCGACLNRCPVYNAVGGHAYESPYSGPMGAILSSTLWGTDHYPDLASACTLCGRCAEVCAVKIPLPDYHRSLRNPGQKTALGSQLAARLTRSPQSWRLGMKGARRLLRQPKVGQWLPRFDKSAAAWALNHQLPQTTDEPSFRQWFQQRSAAAPQVRLARVAGDATAQLPPETEETVVQTDLFALYQQRAAALGVEIQRLGIDQLAVQLQQLLAEESVSVSALPQGVWPTELFQQVSDSLTASGCQIASCSAEQDWDRNLLPQAELGISYSPAYLAETGSLVFSAGPGYGTLASLLPEVQLTLTSAASLYADLKSYLNEAVELMPSRLIQVSGPSRTGDIEGSMSVGVHGPRRVIHWIVG